LDKEYGGRIGSDRGIGATRRGHGNARAGNQRTVRDE
jgi:hypothetical protein